jgi:hypothetical protein
VNASSDNPWNSLEVVKVLTSSLTPLVVAGVGVYIHRLTKRFENLQWRNQKLVEKRLMIYDELAPMFNDNLCYFTFVGNWQERKPTDVIASKRVIDQRMYLAAPLFSPCFFTTCKEFQDLCFEQYTGWGNKAKLKTKFERRRDAWGADWEQAWDSLFSSKVSDPEQVRMAYLNIMRCFSDEMGINKGSIPTTGRIPANIR